MKEELLEKIEKLHELEKYQEIIDTIEALPAEQLNTDLIGQLARAYNNVENYAKGLELLKTIEFEEGHSLIWNWRAGYSYFFLDDFVNAEKCFLKAYELDPDDNDTSDFLITIYRNLAKLENKNGNSEKAIEYALESKKYVYDEEGRIETDFFLAWLYDRYGKYTEAEEILRNQLAENKEDEWTLSELAYCLSAQGKYEEALEYFFTLEKLNKADAWTYRQIGICYKNLDKREDALKYYLKAVELDEEDMYSLSEIAWLYDYFGKYEEALKYLERLEELGQDDSWTNVEYGACLAGLEKYEEAIEKFNYALSLKDEEKDLAFIYGQLGWCYHQLENYEKALEYQLKAKEEGRNDSWTNLEIAICYENLDNYEKALDYALIAYDLDRDNIRILSEVAWIYDCMDNYEEGLPFLLRAEELGRDDEWIKTEIAMNLGRSGKLNEGIEKLKESLTMVDEADINRKILINSELGWYYGKLENPEPEEGLKYLNIAKELGRNDAWIFEVRGAVLLDLKRYQEALDSFKNAYDLNNDGWYLYCMGRCLRGLERYEEAIEILLKSRQISLDEEDVVDGEDFELASCYVGIGDKKNAQKYLDSARDSITERGLLNDYFKEKIEEIEKEILSLDKLFN